MEKKVKKMYAMPQSEAVKFKLNAILMESGGQQEGDQPGGGDD